jgi:hypothetical protein
MSTGRILFIVFGVLGALVLVCGGGLFLVMRAAMQELGRQVAAELRANPVLEHHVGTVESFDMALGESIANDDEDVFVFRVKGSKATGTVTAKCVSLDGATERVAWAKLRLESGKVVDLVREGDVESPDP